MGLVDYSDSESEGEPQPSVAVKPSAKPTAKPFQKFVDRSNPGKILVNLPTDTGASTAPKTSDEPPAKRARTTGGSRFSAFSSFLPPPKVTAKPPVVSQSSSEVDKTAPRPKFSFKTGAEPAFTREVPAADDGDDSAYGDGGSVAGTEGRGSKLKLPLPKSHSANGPSIPAEQKPADDVKLVGKPLMFKPLSVSRKPIKKKMTGTSKTASPAAPSKTVAPSPTAAQPPPEPPKKKVSLFSFGEDTSPPTTDPISTSSAYEPLFSAQPEPSSATYNEPYLLPTHDSPYPQPTTTPTTQPSASSQADLASFADTMNLSKAARRELFGRDGVADPSSSNHRVVNFNMEQEYSHNETIRQSGEAVTHNPVRSIAPGKHNLRQLVNAVQSNASALEESFATQKSKRGEAGARYGWR